MKMLFPQERLQLFREVRMNVHFSFKIAKHPEAQHEIDQQVAKLSRRLQVFRPELVHLHGSLEPGALRGAVQVSLNLRLPSCQLAAQVSGATAAAGLKAAFHELMRQLNAHKELLRRRHKWNHHKSPEQQSEAFDGSIAAIHAPTISQEDIRNYVNANVGKIERFIDRELAYREAIGQIESDVVSREEILDEAIAAALENGEERPEVLSLERWLYRLAIRAIDSTAAANGDSLDSIHLEEHAGRQNVTGSDEAVLQYDQPDEYLDREQTIADPGLVTPEAVAATDEFIAQVEKALHGAKREDREAFVLHALEGFSPEEIARVSDRPLDQVKVSIEAARQRLEKELLAKNAFKSRLTRSA